MVEVIVSATLGWKPLSRVFAADAVCHHTRDSQGGRHLTQTIWPGLVSDAMIVLVAVRFVVAKCLYCFSTAFFINSKYSIMHGILPFRMVGYAPCKCYYCRCRDCTTVVAGL